MGNLAKLLSLAERLYTLKGSILKALFGCLLVTPVGAAQNNAAFNISATLYNANNLAKPTTGFCTMGPSSNTFGAIVTIVCSTGVVVDIQAPKSAVPWVPINGGAYRFMHLTQHELGGQFSGAINSYTGVGTVTSWQTVNQADRSYLEMLIGW